MCVMLVKLIDSTITGTKIHQDIKGLCGKQRCFAFLCGLHPEYMNPYFTRYEGCEICHILLRAELDRRKKEPAIVVLCRVLTELSQSRGSLHSSQSGQHCTWSSAGI